MSPTVGVRSFLQNFTIQGRPGLPVLPSLLCYRMTLLVVRRGLLLVKLGLSLGISQTQEPIEAVVAHELAHRVLDHIRKGNVNCDAERNPMS